MEMDFDLDMDLYEDKDNVCLHPGLLKIDKHPDNQLSDSPSKDVDEDNVCLHPGLLRINEYHHKQFSDKYQPNNDVDELDEDEEEKLERTVHMVLAQSPPTCPPPPAIQHMVPTPCHSNHSPKHTLHHPSTLHNHPAQCHHNATTTNGAHGATSGSSTIHCRNHQTTGATDDEAENSDSDANLGVDLYVKQHQGKCKSRSCKQYTPYINHILDNAVCLAWV
ncbi:hypothetical protein FRB94_004642 [Tulasnella sp. JGI-2019a]|nr:hypothetical protein FRB94_004642 [Tulasnella sp. JGI-2019a]